MLRHVVCLALLVTPALSATYAIDPAQGKLEVTTAKAGLFKSAGHTHVIRATAFRGEVQADPAHPEASRLNLTIDATSLRVLDPEASASDRATVQKNMEGDHTLDVSRFAAIKFVSKKVTVTPKGSASDVVIDGLLQLHGVQQNVRVPCTVTIAGDLLTARGEVELRQKDFDITPFSAGLGSVKVKNEVKITFEIVAKKTGK